MTRFVEWDIYKYAFIIYPFECRLLRRFSFSILSMIHFLYGDSENEVIEPNTLVTKPFPHQQFQFFFCQ